MAFTESYIRLCHQYKSLFRNRIKMKGEWYSNPLTGELRRYGSGPISDFANGEWIYVPELDDLFAFVNNQIMLTQENDRPPKFIALTYKPDTEWQVNIMLDNGIAYEAGQGKSAHEVLFKLLFGMLAFEVTRPSRKKDPKVSIIRGRRREFAWRMEMEAHEALCPDDHAHPTAPANSVTRKAVKPEVERTGWLAKLLHALRISGTMAG